MEKILLFGSTGWIGGKVKKIMQDNNFIVIDAHSRLDSFENIKDEIDNTDFDYCFLCAGITRDPSNPSSNIDWCETHKEVTMNINYLGCLNLIELCRGKKVVYFGTGCIYEYDRLHPVPTKDWDGRGYPGYNENELPNFLKSMYSYSKARFEQEIKDLPNVLTLRLRMPMDSYLSPRNIITKLLKYEKVINIPNSMSVLDDLLPLVPRMLHLNGVYNFVNPGVISHNQILDLYIKHVDSNFKYTNFNLDEQSKVIVAPRSNTALDSSKLLYYFEVPHILESVEKLMIRIKDNFEKND